MEMEMEMGRWRSSSSTTSFPSSVASNLRRRRLLEFLFHSSVQLQVRPIVKYTALSFFAHRFFPSLHSRRTQSSSESWLLQPLRESNLQLFALVSIWISSKIHDSRPLSVKSLKALGDKLVSDQHFTTRDFVEAEVVFLEVLGFDIGSSNIAFIFLEDLHIQFRELSKFGELVSLDVCMEIMDLLYETEGTLMLFFSPLSLAASVLIAGYLISVPKQRWEFPLLPWGARLQSIIHNLKHNPTLFAVTFVTSYTEEKIEKLVAHILAHVLQPEASEQIEESFEL